MKKLLFLTILSATLPATAQDLSTEVIVDRTVAPVENIATRPATLTPVVVLPQATLSYLDPQIYTALSAITRSFDPLLPAGGSYGSEPSPFRGYVSASYGPTLTTDLRGGYHFIQRRGLSAGAALAFTSDSFHSPEAPNSRSNKYADGKVLAYLKWSPDSLSTFTADISGRFLSSATSYRPGTPAQNGTLNVSWNSQAGRIAYGASSQVEYDNMNHIGQTAYDIDLYGAYVFHPGMKLGLDADARGLVTSRHGDSQKLYAITASPFFSFDASGVYTKVSVGLEPSGEESYGYGSTSKFHVTPQFELRAEMSRGAGIWMRATTGTMMTSQNTFRDYSVFLSPCTSFTQNTYLNILAEGGFTFGPGAGLTGEIFGGYASARNWYFIAFDSFFPMDVKGWHIGAKLNYSSQLFNIHAGIDAAPRSDDSDNYWIGNPDCATIKVTAGAEVNPIEALTLGVGYKYVGGRDLIAGDWLGVPISSDFGAVSDLKLHAQYRLNPRLSFHGELNNILNHRYYILYDLPCRGINGLVGLTYKF